MESSPEHHIDWELAGKYLLDEATETERAGFEEWLAADAANARFFASVQQSWEQTGRIGDAELLDREWTAFRERAGMNQAPTRSLRRRLPLWTKIAAAVCLSSLLWLGYEGLQPTHKMRWNEVSTTENERSEVLLPDGSKVFLNRSTQLRYTADFGKNSRELELAGEAYFEVQRDPERPFRIRSGAATTEVLGTSFNIDARHPDDSVRVSVRTGRVAFYMAADSLARLELLPGESGLLLGEARQAQKQIQSNPNYLAWQTRVLRFESRPLPQVFQALERQFQVRIEGQEIFRHCRLTATYEQQSLSQIIDELRLLFELDAEIRSDVVILHGKACSPSH